MSVGRGSGRVFDRTFCELNVVLLDERGREWISLKTKNISSNGLAIETPIGFPHGMRLFLRLYLPDGLAPLDVHAEVLRFIYKKTESGNERIGIGVRFVHLTIESLLRLEHIRFCP